METSEDVMNRSETPAPMDPFGDLITLLQPMAVALKTIEARGSWGLGFNRNREVNFGIVLEGGCLLSQQGSSELLLQAGDFLMQSSPDNYVLRSSPSAAVQDAESLLAAAKGRFVRIDAGDGSLTRILAGHFHFDSANHDLLIEVLPRRLYLPARSIPAGRVASLLALTAEEARARRPGAQAIIERAMEIILIEVLRDASLNFAGDHSGLLAGLQHKLVRNALHALHAAPNRDWTVAELAQTVGASRTVLAQQFRRAVGTAPMDYLVRWRMTLAKASLRHGNRSLKEIASDVGYKSASALSTAFSQRVGCSPRAFRNRENNSTESK